MKHNAIDTTIAWLRSCETEKQIETCRVWIFDTIKCDTMEREELKNEYNKFISQRERIRAKVVLERFPCDDEQPSDNILH